MNSFLINIIKIKPRQPRCSMSILTTKLQYTEFGDPPIVVQKVEDKISSPGDGEILAKILVAPVNPADINTIQGKYPVKPKFPAIPGNECVAEVIEIGNNVKNVNIGDRIIPASTGLGTWVSHSLYKAKDVMKVPLGVGLIEAATMTVNPCTAYRMLKDFVNLQPGNTVIQNGANSAVGQCVIQLSKAWGINNIGIVRDRPNLKNLVSDLKNLGATDILTEEELRKTTIFKENKYERPKLGFNCIGGKSCLEIARNLDHSGVHITYGGMSREPVDIPTGLLIFKDLKFHGFWMTRWTKENLNSLERQIMFDELFKLVINGHLKGPVHELVPVSEYKFVLENALNLKGFTGKKFILDFTKL